MMTRFTWAMLALCLAVADPLGARAQSADPATAPEMAALDAAVVAAERRADPLFLYDTILRMQVLAGTLAAPAADAELARRAGEWAGRTPSAAELATIMAEHRQAMEQLLAAAELSIASAQWPTDRPAEEYAALVPVALQRIRATYDEALAQGGDLLPAAMAVEALLARMRGAAQLAPADSVFAGQDSRVAAVRQAPSAATATTTTTTPAATVPAATPEERAAALAALGEKLQALDQALSAATADPTMTVILVNGQPLPVPAALVDSAAVTAQRAAGVPVEMHASLRALDPDEFALLDALGIDLSAQAPAPTAELLRQRLAERAQRDAAALQAMAGERAAAQAQLKALGAPASADAASAAGMPAPGQMSLAWVDFKGDRVSSTAVEPNGAPDGHFRLALTLAQPAEIKSIGLLSADDSGKAAFGQYWHTAAGGSTWVLGVFAGERRVNATYVPSLGAFEGGVVFDLYAESSGYFKDGQNFRVEVALGTGETLVQTARIGAPPPPAIATTTTPAATTTPATTTTAATTTATPAAGAGAAVMIVLDVSNSMWGQVEGRPKIEIAREAIAKLLDSWKPGVDLGLTAYGHRREGDCGDIEALLPAGPLDRDAFMKTVAGLTPTGKTPLTAAVRQAAAALARQDRPATVVLFSDGIETCNADPCALATELQQGGVRLTVHVVGLDVKASEAQLACLPQATGGLFLTADSAAQLDQALSTVASAASEPARADLITLEAVEEGSGKTIASGVAWSVVGLDSEASVPISAGMARPALPLAPGRYSAEARVGAASARAEFTVVAGQAQTVQVPIGAAAVLAAAGCAEPNDSFGAAPAMTLAGTLGGSIDPVRDGDFCSFSAPGAGVLGVGAAQAPQALQIVYRVYTADGALARDWSNPVVPGQPAVSADLPEAGRYVMEIRDSYDDAAAPETYGLSLAFTPAVDETEPNESFGAAAPLAFGKPAKVAVFPQREHNFLQLTAERQGELKVSARQVPPGIDVALRLYDSDYAVVRDWVAPSQPGQDTLLAADLPAPGRYVLEVTDSHDDARDPAPFTLLAELTPTVDGFEPNNSLGRAAPLAFDAPVQAAILPQRDVDFFAFDAAHRGAFKIVAGPVPANLNIALRLYDANYALVQDWVTSPTPGQETILLADLPAAGRYTLEVRDGNEDARAVDPYTLTATLAAAEDGNEPNDRFARASALGLAEATRTSILPRGDADFFRIESVRQGPITIKASGVPPKLDVALRLYNQDLAVVRDWTVPSQAGQDTILQVELAAAGTYFLEVRDANNDASAPEAFTVIATQP